MKADRDELAELWLLRHGQSIGNVANEAAHGADVEQLDLAECDMDVELSDLGRHQATAFGEWLGAVDGEKRPDIVVASPYVRAADTARIVSDTPPVSVSRSARTSDCASESSASSTC